MPIKPAPSPTTPSADVSPLLGGLNAGNLLLGGEENSIINSRRCSIIGSEKIAIGNCYNSHVVGNYDTGDLIEPRLMVNFDPSKNRGLWNESTTYSYGDIVLHEGYFWEWVWPDSYAGIEPGLNYVNDLWFRAGIKVSISSDENYLIIDEEFSFQNERFALGVGTYYFQDVPQNYPIAFLRKNKPVNYGGQYWGGSTIISGEYYDFFYGNVVLNVKGDFDIMSCAVLKNGSLNYMGGYNIFSFDENANSVPLRKLSVNLDYSGYTENALTQEDQNTLRSMCDYFEEVILCNLTVDYESTREDLGQAEQDINYNLEVVDFSSARTSEGGGVLAFAGPTSSSYRSINGTRYWTAISGRMGVDPLDLEYLRSTTSSPGKNALYWTMLHEVGHAFSIGTSWNSVLTSGGTFFAIANNYIRLSEQNGAQYIGENAVREYNRLVGGNFDSLPVQTYLTSTAYVSEDPNLFLQLNFTSLSLSLSSGADQLIFEIVDEVIYILNSGNWNQLSAPGFEDGFYIFHGAGQDPELRFWNDPWKPNNNTDYIDLIVKIPESLAPYVPGNFPSSAIGQTFDYVMYMSWKGHWAELDADSIGGEGGYRVYTNPDGTTVNQPYISDSIMTPYADEDVSYWSRLDNAFLHDLGYIVDYSVVNPIVDVKNEYSSKEYNVNYKQQSELLTNSSFTGDLSGWATVGDVSLVSDSLCVLRNQAEIYQSINIFKNATYYLRFTIRASINVDIESIQINSQYTNSGNPIPEKWDDSKVYQYGEVVHYTDSNSFSGIYQRKSADPGSSGFSPDRYLPSGLPEEYIYWDIIELNINILEENILSKKFGNRMSMDSVFEIPFSCQCNSINLKFSNPNDGSVSSSLRSVSVMRQFTSYDKSPFFEANHQINVFGKLRVTGDIFTSHISDSKLKENKKIINDCNTKVEKMNPVSFIWNEKQDAYSGQDIGLIAQDVESVCPYVVEQRKNGYKAIRYEKINSILIGSIKESNNKLKTILNKLNNEY